MQTMPATLWIAACAHRLHRQWHTVDLLELEDVARDLWRDEQLRAMWPEDAATHWLRPVIRTVLAPAPLNFSLTGKPSPAGQPVRGP